MVANLLEGSYKILALFDASLGGGEEIVIGKEEIAVMEAAFTILCGSCLLKGGMCAHLKEIMKIQLGNTGIDGSKLCPLLIAAAGIVLSKPDEEASKC